MKLQDSCCKVGRLVNFLYDKNNDMGLYARDGICIVRRISIDGESQDLQS